MRRNVNTGTDAHETLCQAYEFALAHVGQDQDSGDIWMDYIQFLKSEEVNVPIAFEIWCYRS
jgi:cleavage stimulation factor subunit 3